MNFIRRPAPMPHEQMFSNRQGQHDRPQTEARPVTAPRSQKTIGLTLAIFGALLLTPDTLFMRLSQLDGFNMLLWRGGLSGLAYFMIWLWMRGPRDLSNIWTRNFAIIVACQTGNAALFSLAIALAPVIVVLIGVATVPIFAALLSRLLLGEALSMRTLITAAMVFLGLFISVLGSDDGHLMLDLTTLIGAGLGLGVAFSLAMNFTIIRKDTDVPFVLAIAVGAIAAAGLAAVFATTLAWPPLPQMAAIALTGIFILPLSFVTLSYAARFVPSSTVSLIMLLETVLGPLWVWWGIGEAPSAMMLIGGGIVLTCLSVFLILEGRKAA
ncbi:DMT family transporter [Planktomarina temperata]|uniref:DMT family transporter n=2 Tax=Planktomarina TaxID=1284657 RepID=UPI0023035C22|nr:DMT family transporter [Planktomarina temperata]MDA7458318.1 DMT family transporter [Planktomarina temperata]MDA7475065.1 DMT family transporter [Planktomarina temperata]MDA8830240.1 DMT family transporter [Planktomarina temperata]MDA8983346.1 DMT family transporter [Planktomarina temperata]